MNRLWWGLFGVAILASQTGCRNSCGERRFQLFSRDCKEKPPAQLMSNPGGSCPTGALAMPMSYPGTAPGFDGGIPTVPAPTYPGPTYPGTSTPEPPTIPPTYLPATPVPAIPSAKNVLPPPKELVPPTGVTGYGK